MRRVLFGAIIISAMARSGVAQQTNVETKLDHVIVGVANLNEATTAFAARTGVTPIFGGRHPGRGTQNALVSLGAGRYLELIAPVPDSALSPSYRILPTLSVPTPIGFAITTSDLERTRTRFTAAGVRVGAVAPGARVTPSGDQLAWRTLELPDLGVAHAPFVIEWSAGTHHPSTTTPSGCRMQSLIWTLPDPARARRLAATAALDIAIVQGATEGLALTLACPKGVVHFP